MGLGAAAAGGAGRRGEIDATFEVRLRQPMRHLGGKLIPGPRYGSYSYPWLRPDVATVPSGTLLIPTVCNPTADDLRSRVEEHVASGGRVVCDSDANVFALDAPHFDVYDVMKLSHRPMPRSTWQWWCKGYRELVRAADLVTVASPALVDVYLDAGARRVMVIPNAVEREQWTPEPPARTDGVFTVGYAGGPGHDDSLELIRPALQWASAQPNAESILFGTTPGPSPLGGFAVVTIPREWAFPCERLHWISSYAEYRRTLTGLLDVGLMPLAATEYNSGRSDLKVLELAMAGALPIVQDAENYAAWRDTPVLFASSADEFLEHVQWAVANPGEVRERARAVRELVLRTRTIDQTIALWREAVIGVSPLSVPVHVHASA